MTFLRTTLISTLFVAVLLSVSSCSDVQNREKKSESSTGAVANIKVVNRTTTTGAQTTETLDKKIEKAVTKNLSQVLIVGATDESLFVEGLASTATTDLPDNENAKKNSADVSLHYMASDNENDEVVVADITQTITDKSDTKSTRAGKIFFDTQGLILGYSFPDTTPTSAPKASS